MSTERCMCGEMLAQFTVRKEGANKGRIFLSCAKRGGKSCNFFKWVSPPIAASSAAKLADSSIGSIKRKVSTNESYSGGGLGIDFSRAIFAYTDGSCIGNQSVATRVNPAGWGVVVMRPNPQTAEHLVHSDISYKDFAEHHANVDNCEEIISLYGPVVIDPVGSLSSYYLGATLGSNNTGELCAISEALIYIKQVTERRIIPFEHVFICYDSEYAAKSITGEYNGKKNKELITQARRLYQDASTTLLHATNGNGMIRFLHVKAHSGHYWNEMADKLANDGARGHICTTGRYADATHSISRRSEEEPRKDYNFINEELPLPISIFKAHSEEDGK